MRRWGLAGAERELRFLGHWGAGWEMRCSAGTGAETLIEASPCHPQHLRHPYATGQVPGTPKPLRPPPGGPECPRVSPWPQNAWNVRGKLQDLSTPSANSGVLQSHPCHLIVALDCLEVPPRPQSDWNARGNLWDPSTPSTNIGTLESHLGPLPMASECPRIHPWPPGDCDSRGLIRGAPAPAAISETLQSHSNPLPSASECPQVSPRPQSARQCHCGLEVTGMRPVDSGASHARRQF